ncbi:acyltransferase family protein [Enterococcus cecorum]
MSWLDVLKGIGIVLVTIGHIYSNRTVFNWLYSFHMPLFFLAAGWVYKEKPVLTDIKRRIQTIVVPYFSFGLLVIIYWQMIERRFRDSDMSFMDSLFGLFSGCYDNLDFDVHLWFLPYFFATVVLFNILANLGGKKIAYIVAALMSLIYVALPMPELPWGINRVFKYIGFYAVGVFLTGRETKIVDRKIRTGVVAVVLLILNFFLSYHNLATGIMWLVTALIGVLALILISQLINQNRVLQYLGRISLIILCIHGPVYRIVVKIVSIPLHMGTDAVRENFLLAMIVVAVTMLICSVAYEIVVRIAPWMVGKKQC